MSMRYDSLDLPANAPDELRLDQAVDLLAKARGVLPADIREDDARYFREELTKQRAEVYTRRYPSLQFADGQVIKVRRTLSNGQVAGRMETVSHYGVSVWANGADIQDIFASSSTRSRQSYTQHEHRSGYKYDIADQEADSAAGRSLKTEDSFGAKRSCMKRQDDVFFQGDASKGLYGLTNHPNIQVVDAPAGTNGTYRWSTTGGNAKSAVELVEDIGLIKRVLRSRTELTEDLSTVLVPPSFWERAAQVYREGTSDSAKSMIMATYAGVKFKEIRRLEEAGTYGGPVMIGASSDALADSWLEGSGYTEHGPWQAQLFEWHVIGRQFTGGFLTKAPMGFVQLEFPED